MNPKGEWRFVDESYSFCLYELILRCASEPLDLTDYFTDLPFPEGRLVAGFDVGRSHDRSELAVFEEVGCRFICRMLRCYDRVPFAEQEADLLRMLNTFPVARLSIDKSGIGMKLAEDVDWAFQQVVHEAFIYASKERWCIDSKILLQRRYLDLPRDREVVSQIHDVKRRFTPVGQRQLRRRAHWPRPRRPLLGHRPRLPEGARAEPPRRGGGGGAGDRVVLPLMVDLARLLARIEHPHGMVSGASACQCNSSTMHRIR